MIPARFGRAALVVSLLAVAGCVGQNTQTVRHRGILSEVPYVVAVKPPPGVIYSRVRAPLQWDFDGNLAGAATTKTAAEKTRYFSVPFFPFISFAWDRADLERIAAKGGIAEVAYTDYEYFTILGVYSEFTIHVYGN